MGVFFLKYRNILILLRNFQRPTFTLVRGAAAVHASRRVLHTTVSDLFAGTCLYLCGRALSLVYVLGLLPSVGGLALTFFPLRGFALPKKPGRLCCCVPHSLDFADYGLMILFRIFRYPCIF